MESERPKQRSPLPGPRLIRRVVTYYLALAGAYSLFRYVLVRSTASSLASAPDSTPRTRGLPATGGLDSLLASLDASLAQLRVGEGSLAIAAVAAMCGAALLSVPVAWLYTLTRQKRGYRQSVVQTLVLLPAVVAGVVVLVKLSLALAFSLAGIIAAVRFRTTLEDSKDAVYIFLATGIGLAAGVDLSVAVVLSVVFNILSLCLWYMDFGRSPVRLEGPDAEKRMERALALANRTGMFVARVDNEILKDMAPEQLEALANRAWRRRKRNAPDASPDAEPRFDSLLRVRTVAVDSSRQAVEAILDKHTKRWRFGGVVHEHDGSHTVEYGVQLRRGTGSEPLIASLRERGAPDVIEVEIK